MALLAEYAITPGIFEASSSSCAEVLDERLLILKDVLLGAGIVRDLRDGRWSQLFSEVERPWHRRSKELLKKLISQGRLRPIKSMLDAEPVSDIDWCCEALASKKYADTLTGIITTADAAQANIKEDCVAGLERLRSKTWWCPQDSSVILARTVADYLHHLALVLECSNSIMFIDAHLDPTQMRYRDFRSILLKTAGRRPVPTLEIHRVCWFNSANRTNQKNENGWLTMFSSWEAPLRSAGVGVDVFIWDDFHDRYVISNLIGIQLGNGLDTTIDPHANVTWSRLSRSNRDYIQKEFDPASKRHELQHHFRVGAPR